MKARAMSSLRSRAIQIADFHISLFRLFILFISSIQIYEHQARTPAGPGERAESGPLLRQLRLQQEAEPSSR